MATAMRALRRFQLGPESTAGTAVPATFKMVGDTEYTQHIERDFEEFPRQVFAPVTGGGIDQAHSTLVSHKGNLNVQELLHVLAMCIGTPTTSGESAPFTHTFDRSWTGSPTIKTYTGELTDADGGGTKHRQKEAAFLFGKSFEVGVGMSAPATMAFTAEARKAGSTTETAALAALVGRRPLPGNLAKLFIDNDWASLGGTQISTAIRALTLKYESGVSAGFTLDGRATLDHTKLDYGSVMASLSGSIELAADAAAEYAKWITASLRFMRLSLSYDANNAVKFDICGKYTEDPTFSEDNGLVVMSFNLGLEYDATSGKAFKAEVVSNLASLADVTGV